MKTPLFIVTVFFACIIFLSCMGNSNTNGNNSTSANVTTTAGADQQLPGRQLFMGNCAQCHHPTRDLAAPTIYGVRNRWKNKKLLYEFVRSSTTVIKKDKYAKDLFDKWNKVVMPDQPSLKDADINAIFDYVDGEAKKKGLL